MAIGNRTWYARGVEEVQLMGGMFQTSAGCCVSSHSVWLCS